MKIHPGSMFVITQLNWDWNSALWNFGTRGSDVPFPTPAMIQSGIDPHHLDCFEFSSSPLLKPIAQRFVKCALFLKPCFLKKMGASMERRKNIQYSTRNRSTTPLFSNSRSEIRFAQNASKSNLIHMKSCWIQCYAPYGSLFTKSRWYLINLRVESLWSSSQSCVQFTMLSWFQVHQGYQTESNSICDTSDDFDRSIHPHPDWIQSGNPIHRSEQNQSDQFGKIIHHELSFGRVCFSTRTSCALDKSSRSWFATSDCCMLLLNFAALNTNATRKQTMFRSQKTFRPVP